MIEILSSNLFDQSIAIFYGTTQTEVLSGTGKNLTRWQIITKLPNLKLKIITFIWSINKNRDFTNFFSRLSQ